MITAAVKTCAGRLQLQESEDEYSASDDDVDSSVESSDDEDDEDNDICDDDVNDTEKHKIQEMHCVWEFLSPPNKESDLLKENGLECVMLADVARGYT